MEVRRSYGWKLFIRYYAEFTHTKKLKNEMIQVYAKEDEKIPKLWEG